MEDCELLEFAAKAIGYKAYFNWADACQLSIDGTSDGYVKFWNPLNDDGDALRLAMDLDLSVTPYPIYENQRHSVMVRKPKLIDGKDNGVYVVENFNDDKYAATRRAIVRAAAEIGKAQPQKGRSE